MERGELCVVHLVYVEWLAATMYHPAMGRAYVDHAELVREVYVVVAAAAVVVVAAVVAVIIVAVAVCVVMCGVLYVMAFYVENLLNQSREAPL
jgi:hypothetical protein